ncbi:MAG TPA: hypothetical protein VJZ71_09160 [Phycisphaerae bacterium]|nr:hypothetical protein [Phycisphaerae bacterium]
MMRITTGWGWTSALLLLTSPLLAQNQPWRAPNGALSSTVITCTSPQPLQRIAMDDFQFSATTVIKKIRWWGVVLDPNQNQLTRTFYIAIWGNNTAGPCPAGCNPSTVQAFWCLKPSYAYAGLDCQGRKVYRFTVCLPGGGFAALTAFKYWLQISEIDTDSPRSGVEDFRWSGYRDPQEADHTRLCDAQQRDAGGAIFCTIFDDCSPPVETDLSYVLYTSCYGVLLPPVILPPITGLLEFRAPGLPNSPPLMVECVQFDEEGQGHIETELPDGDYEVTFIGMGMVRPKTMLMIQNGEGTSSFFDVFVGDLNNDGYANGMDMQPFTDGLLMGP